MVAHVAHANDPRYVAYGRGELIEPHDSILGRQYTNLHTTLAQTEPGQHARRKLQVADEDFVTGVPVDAIGECIQRVARAGKQSHVAGVHTKQAGDTVQCLRFLLV